MSEEKEEKEEKRTEEIAAMVDKVEKDSVDMEKSINILAITINNVEQENKKLQKKLNRLDLDLGLIDVRIRGFQKSITGIEKGVKDLNSNRALSFLDDLKPWSVALFIFFLLMVISLPSIISVHFNRVNIEERGDMLDQLIESIEERQEQGQGD